MQHLDQLEYLMILTFDNSINGLITDAFVISISGKSPILYFLYILTDDSRFCTLSFLNISRFTFVWIFFIAKCLLNTDLLRDIRTFLFCIKSDLESGILSKNNIV